MDRRNFIKSSIAIIPVAVITPSILKKDRKTHVTKVIPRNAEGNFVESDIEDKLLKAWNSLSPEEQDEYLRILKKGVEKHG